MSFKSYYADPIFRENFKKYILTKVECKLCGCVTQRTNMTRHRRTEKCQKITKKRLEESMDTETQLIEPL